MNPPTLPTLRTMAAALSLALAASGCATVNSAFDVKTPTVEAARAAQTGTPELAPRRAITGFSAALRCMDTLLVDYGVRDIGMLVEDITDRTTKVNAGTRDMLITAMSDMTRRSRAVRVVAYGRDAGNAISFLASAQKNNPYQVVPAYDIKGSVSQWDENVIRTNKDLGAGAFPWLNLGISRDAAASVLGLDLSVLTTDDMSVLAGVTSRNSVVILKQGKGIDGDAAYSKFGISYTMSLSKSEGQTQALRGLVELAAIELTGKLTKVPYWTCLGGDPATSDEVKLEIGDWYAAMAASRVELIGWFQNQLSRRGFYRGPVDGKFNPAIDIAIGNYREKLGMTNKALLDEALFRAFLAADHTKIARPGEPATFTPPVGDAGTAPANDAPVAAVPPPPLPTPMVAMPGPYMPPPVSDAFVLTLETTPHRAHFAPGEQISLRVRSNRDAYVYCYMQDETRRVTRFYPNRFDRDPLLARGRTLELPGRQRFRILMNPRGVRETIRCFATERDVLAQLPEVVVGGDFEPLPISSLQPVYDAIARATGGVFTQATVQYEPK